FIVPCETTDKLLIFASDGRFFTLGCDKLPSARGHGIGKALIEWLRNAMRAEGWARVYWVTQQDNARARRLYDQFTKADGFVRYVLK
ncbi:GNAT family N-acetyltransferase, partial [Priestia megaterium]|uniref:GNAT family N-acetyltransferase n=1 Tax=Priestia megaterium TaxID=1404 RepID=UPI0035B57730